MAERKGPLLPLESLWDPLLETWVQGRSDRHCQGGPFPPGQSQEERPSVDRVRTTLLPFAKRGYRSKVIFKVFKYFSVLEILLGLGQ